MTDDLPAELGANARLRSFAATSNQATVAAERNINEVSRPFTLFTLPPFPPPLLPLPGFTTFCLAPTPPPCTGVHAE